MPIENNMWIEWIPNISSGDLILVKEIETVFQNIPLLYLLHTDCGPEVNRTVFTLIGTTTSLHQAVFELVSFLNQKLDMTEHSGTHPRMGALDVCPFVRLKNGSATILQNWVSNLAEELSNTFDFPIYLYEDSASSPYRRNLADIRKGEYEALENKMMMSEWIPDYGRKFHPGLGATVMGVRDFLIAYNVNLNTSNIEIAVEIARAIRSKGKPHRTHRLPGLKAIGWHLKEMNFCQVSTNITDINATTPWDVYIQCTILADKYNCRVTGSELIGLIPYQAVRKMEEQSGLDRKKLTRKLRLSYAGVDDLQERMIEYNAYIGSGKKLFTEFFKEK